jgi:hypothetical protein
LQLAAGEASRRYSRNFVLFVVNLPLRLFEIDTRVGITDYLR